MTGGLVFRAHHDADPATTAALDALLFEIFKLDLGPLDSIAGRDPSYTSFSYFDEAGRCVANASLCALPLVVRGRPVDALGVQSVAVRPELRGRGLFRDLMQRALAWCDARVPLVLLTTVTPELYGRFGFRVIPEHRIVGPAPEPDAGAMAARPIDLRAELSLVKRLLDERQPVSELVGLRHHGPMFLMNVLAMPQVQLHCLADCDAIVVSEARVAGTLTLHDIVGRRIPSVAAILGALRLRPERIEICFPTDKLCYRGEALPAERRTKLMARGEFIDGTEPFMLPPTAAF